MKSKTALLKTLIYADLFDYPLTESELWRYFIGQTFKLQTFREGIQSLLSEKRIIYKDSYYALKGREGCILLRKKRERISIKKINFAKRIIKILCFLPTVYFVGISGAVAMHNAPENDDIDLFIISAPHRVWTTRFLVTLLFAIIGVRRKPNATDVKNRICLNMYLDSAKLTFPKSDQTLYTAHEIVQIQTLVNKHAIYEYFLYKNRWLQQWLPHVAIRNKKNKKSTHKDSGIGKLFERFFKEIQLLYMHRRQTTEKISSFILSFHPFDTQKWVETEFLKKCKEIL